MHVVNTGEKNHSSQNVTVTGRCVSFNIEHRNFLCSLDPAGWGQPQILSVNHDGLTSTEIYKLSAPEKTQIYDARCEQNRRRVL